MIQFVDVSRVLASLSSLVMISSPMPSIIRTYRNKSTGYLSIVPLASMLLNVHLLMTFGYLSEQYFPVFVTFAIGEVLAIGYTSIFYYYSKEKAKAHKIFLMYSIPYITLTTYAIVGGLGYTNQTRHEVGNVIGYFTIFTNFVVFSSPLEKVRPVLKNQSAVFFNIHMIIAGTICNIMWVIYSSLSLSKRWILFASNAASLVSAVIEITLYIKYRPSKHPMPALPLTASMATMVAPAAKDDASPTSGETDDDDDLKDVTHITIVAVDDDDKDNDSCFVAIASPHSVNDDQPGHRV